MIYWSVVRHALNVTLLRRCFRPAQRARQAGNRRLRQELRLSQVDTAQERRWLAGQEIHHREEAKVRRLGQGTTYFIQNHSLSFLLLVGL